VTDDPLSLAGIVILGSLLALLGPAAALERS